MVSKHLTKVCLTVIFTFLNIFKSQGTLQPCWQDLTHSFVLPPHIQAQIRCFVGHRQQAFEAEKAEILSHFGQFLYFPRPHVVCRSHAQYCLWLGYSAPVHLILNPVSMSYDKHQVKGPYVLFWQSALATMWPYSDSTPASQVKGQ